MPFRCLVISVTFIISLKMLAMKLLKENRYQAG